MESTDDLQKLSVINIAAYYKEEAVLPLILRTNNLITDTLVFYTDQNRVDSSSGRVRAYYKYISLPL